MAAGPGAKRDSHRLNHLCASYIRSVTAFFRKLTESRSLNEGHSHSLIIAGQLEYCSFSVHCQNKPHISESSLTPYSERSASHLPAVHLILFVFVLFQQLVQHLFQTVRVGLQCRNHVLHRSLNQDAVDHSEAFSVSRKRLQGFNNEPVRQSRKIVSAG